MIVKVALIFAALTPVVVIAGLLLVWAICVVSADADVQAERLHRECEARRHGR